MAEIMFSEKKDLSCNIQNIHYTFFPFLIQCRLLYFFIFWHLEGSKKTPDNIYTCERKTSFTKFKSLGMFFHLICNELKNLSRAANLKFSLLLKQNHWNYCPRIILQFKILKYYSWRNIKFQILTYWIRFPKCGPDSC